MSCFRLDDRSIIKISGQDTLPFLQGLLTCDVSLLKEGEQEILYGAFLNAKGKFISDVFVVLVQSSPEITVYLDCLKEHVSDILLKLKAFKLRSKIGLSSEENIMVWGSFEKENFLNILTQKADPRMSDLGFRLYTESAPDHHEESYIRYKKACIQNFISLGYDAMTYEKSFIMEFGFDRWNAVSFSKGCYLGQELTASMHYRKLAKREVVWGKLDTLTEKDLVGCDLEYDEEKVGRVLNRTEDLVLLHLHKNILDEAVQETKDAEKELLVFKNALKVCIDSDVVVSKVYRRIYN